MSQGLLLWLLRAGSLSLDKKGVTRLYAVARSRSTSSLSWGRGGELEVYTTFYFHKINDLSAHTQDAQTILILNRARLSISMILETDKGNVTRIPTFVSCISATGSRHSGLSSRHHESTTGSAMYYCSRVGAIMRATVLISRCLSTTCDFMATVLRRRDDRAYSSMTYHRHAGTRQDSASSGRLQGTTCTSP